MHAVFVLRRRVEVQGLRVIGRIDGVVAEVGVSRYARRIVLTIQGAYGRRTSRDQEQQQKESKSRRK